MLASWRRADDPRPLPWWLWLAIGVAAGIVCGVVAVVLVAWALDRSGLI